MRLLLAIATVLTFACLVSPDAFAAQSSAVDYARLAHPEVADALGLSDEQRAKIQQLLQQKADVLAAQPEDQAAQVKQIHDSLLAALTETQRQQFEASGTDTGQLQFKFQQQPWPEVLQWFASQEGLTLVMNQVPPGTFTYNDNRSYTAAEAIDLLNSVLLTRGYTLVRREKMLTLLQLSNSLPIELIPRVKLEELPSRGRFELVSVLFPLGTRPVDAVMREVQPYLGTYGRAVPLPQSKQLLVVESAGKMATINVLINTVPEPKVPPKPAPPAKPPEPVFAAYSLGELDPAATLETIRSLVGSDRITIDEKSRLLTAFVIPGQQTAIQSFLESMRASVGESPSMSSRSYEIGAGTGEQLREQILAIAPAAKVTVDAVAQRLYVTASATQQEAITAALKEMGLTTADVLSEVKAFRVTPEQAVTLSTAMQSMLPEATVVGNATLGTIVVRGTPEDILLADQVIERWKGGDVPEDLVVHTFPLAREADAAWLETVRSLVPQAELQLADDARGVLLLGTTAQKARLESLLPQLEKTLPEPKENVLQTRLLEPEQLARWQQLESMVSAQWPDIRTVMRQQEDGKATELWVWADAETQEEITELLEQLKQPSDGSTPRWPQRYPLEGRSRSLVLELISENHPETRVSDSDSGDALTIWATPETHEAIAKTMSEVSQRLPAAPVRELRSYQLRGMTGAELQTLITPLTTTGELVSEPTPTLTVDPQGRRLLVFATGKTHESIEMLMRELDQPVPADEEMVFLPYTLENAEAADVKTLLDAALDNATIVADPNGRQLVVTATLAEHARIKTLLTELDRPLVETRKTEMRAYEIRELNVSSLLPTLQSMWPRMSMSVDAASNKLVATGNAADHAGLSQAIERLNAAPEDAGLSVKTYEVPAGDLTTLPNVLLQLAPTALISADTTNRVLVVWANETQHARIAQAIEQLQKSATDRKQVQIYRVRPEQTSAIQTVLANLFPTVTVSSDPTLGQLTVLATGEQQERISEVITKVGDAREEGWKPEPRIYDVPERVRAAFSSLLASNAPRATMLAGAATRPEQMMLLATADDHLRIEAMLKQLVEQVPETGERTLRVYDLDAVDPTTLQSMMSERVPEARIVSGTGTDQWLVLAKPDDHEELQALLGELGVVYDALPERELRGYKVREDLVPQATTGLAAEFPKVTVLPVTGVPGQLSILAKPEEHTKVDAWLKRLAEEVPAPEKPSSQVFTLERGNAASVARALLAMEPRISVTSETVGNRVIVSALPEQMERVSKVIEQIEAGTESGQTTESYVLESGAAATLRPALMASFPDATIAADAVNNVLIISASPEDHEAIRRVIEQQNKATKRELSTETYVLEQGDAITFRAALQASFPRAVVSADSTTNALVVSANTEDQAAIAKVIEQQNAKIGEGRSTRSYRLEEGNVTTLRLALQASFPQATVGSDTVNNVLVVSASETDQAAIAKVIKEQNEVAATSRVARSYRLKEGNATTLRLALEASFPKATIASDTVNNVLIVSADAETQDAIAKVIEEQNTLVADDRTTRSYRLKDGDATTLRVALQAGFPRATIGSDATNNLLIVSADEEDQTAIAKLIEEEIANSSEQRTTQVYALEAGSAATMRLALIYSFPDASIGADTADNLLIVTADQEDQAAIAKLIQEQLAGVRKSQETQVYPMKAGSAATLQLALRYSFPDALVGADTTNNALIVTADAEDQAAIAKVVEAQNNTGANKTTQSYVLEAGSAATLRLALQASFPDATVAADTTNNTLIVSADTEDQQSIAKVVEQQNQAEDLGERLEAYVLEHADPETVAETLENAFGRRSGVGVSVDRESGSVFVVGLSKQQRIAAELVKKLDQPSTGMRQRQLKAFSLAGVDGSEVAESVESLFEDARPEVDVRYDFFNEQLVVIATEQQMQLLEATLEQFSAPERELEIVALTENDPDSVRDAIDALFEDIPVNELPSITVDEDRQQLLIRATTKQHEEISELLERLGEQVTRAAPTGAAATNQQRTSRVRTIPVGRDAERMLERLREVWPDLRGNPIRVIQPAVPGVEKRGAAAGAVPVPQAGASESDAAKLERRRGVDGEAATTIDSQAAVPRNPWTYVNEQVETQENVGDAEASEGPQKQPGDAVIIVPGAGRWTVVSQDADALNLLEQLVRVSVSPPVIPVTTSGNTSVYVLQHADAEDLEQLLETLFRPPTRGSQRSSIIDRDNTQIVADRRINALVIKSSRADRGVIEDLLAVLDSPEFIDALRTASPEIIPVRYADAERVQQLVSTVYAEQMSSDGGRPEIDIPAGVSDEVATLLQQLNAETSGPLLTLSVDEVTNSLVMRAPPELAEEVRRFISSVDERTATERSQKLRIIRLRGGNAEAIGELLDSLRRGR